MPYMATMDVQGTVGASWEWGVEVTDDDNAFVDFTGCTGSATIRERVGGDVIINPVVVCTADGEVTCTVSDSNSATLTPGAYTWELQVVDGDGRTVKLVGGGDSRFTIKPEVI